MAPIDECMIRRRAEHNDGVLETLEEIVLQEEGIEKIETLARLCPNLKQIYMPNNLISKIENMYRLKSLEYLNLALNNISKVEGLHGCEVLNKLDLTLNFVDKENIITVLNLQANIHLTELFLTGNPCSDFPGYRQFVIAAVPSLKANSAKKVLTKQILCAHLWNLFGSALMQMLSDLLKELLHSKWDFKLTESDCGKLVLLDVAVGRYLDSSLIDIDVNPTLVRILVKGKLLQLKLPCEVRVDESHSKRSRTTGRLLVTFPKVTPDVRGAYVYSAPIVPHLKSKSNTKKLDPTMAQKQGETPGDVVSIHNIVHESNHAALTSKVNTSKGHAHIIEPTTLMPSKDTSSTPAAWESDVPPLE